MDPVSAAASAIAFVQAAAAIGKGINALRSLGKAPAEVCALLNELTTLQSLSSRVQQNHLSPLDGGSDAKVDDLGLLKKLCEDLSATVDSLKSLVERFDDTKKRLNKPGQRQVLQIKWMREREHVYQLRDKARLTREYLSAFLVSMNSSESAKQAKIILQVEGMFHVSAKNLSQSAEENIGLLRDTKTSLLRIEEGLATLQRTQAESMEHLRSLGVGVQVSSLHEWIPNSRPLPGTPCHLHREGLNTKGVSLDEDSILCFDSFVRPLCSATCRCQCHKSSSIASPGYLHSVLGTFFLSYNTFPLCGIITCDFAGCTTTSNSKVRFYYHLPTWLFSRAILFSASWSSLTGVGASLHLKLPRTIPSCDPIWEALRRADINRIRQRFATKLNSPTDISSDGMSLFLYGMSRGNYAVIETLLRAGCDISVKSINGSSPAATARARILTSDVNPISERFFHIYKQIIHLDEERDYLNSTVAHDSILRLNSISLAEAIALEPQSINSLDGMGYAALHWAVKKRNVDAMNTLLHFNSNPDIQDRNHRTALHIAARHGLFDISCRLLHAGCDSNARDSTGKTALHMACSSSSMDSTRIVQQILRHQGLPNIQDSTNQFTPLNELTWQCLARDPWDCEGKIDALLKAGADLDEADKWGCTPLLHAASIPWDNELFQLLYNRGARIDLTDGMKRSILHYAAAYGDLDHIEYLRQLALSGPDPESKDQYRHTPLSLMEWRSRTEARKLWTNMRRPTADELASFRYLIAEIKGRRQDARAASMPCLGRTDQDEGLSTTRPNNDVLHPDRCNLQTGVQDEDSEEEYVDALDM
ncbi:ankyrin repeat-containing domain protein [Thelonectria olida]|uniref:Ankyrin repeat-containing domain protein n=1 Tax=Thelonectria olida TaxID=1576542 RepID=A0A9P9AMR7_9HYPO|nr:ankyrin repeat-containing domain protein [Thelonectria olida]